MIKNNIRLLKILVVLVDSMAIFIAFLLSWIVRIYGGIFPLEQEYLGFNNYILPIMIIIPIFILLNAMFGLYTSSRYRRFYLEVIKIFEANSIGILILIFFLFLIKEIDFSRTLLAVFYFISSFAIVSIRIFMRLVLRFYRIKGYNKWHILVIGNSSIAFEFIKRINYSKYLGYNIIGMIDDKLKNEDVKKINNIDVLGCIDELEGVLVKHYIDEIFITLDLKEYKKLKHIIKVTEKYGIRTQIIPDYTRYIPAKPSIEDFDGLPVINIRKIPLDSLVNKVLKRSFDILGSLALIIVFSPIMLVVILLIKITSPGPVVFKQERVGLNNKTFTMYKFRSMKLQKKDEEKVEWTTKNDPRKTPIGTFIRKTSIDELPQFFNVLMGDMSLVGPRPERPFFVDKFKEEIPKYMVKHQIRPGITGWAQVSGLRGDTSIEKRVEFDIYYLENWSLIFDIKILFLTAFKGFVNKNAY